MKKNWMKKGSIAIVIGAVSLASLAGCGGKVTAGSLMKDMDAELKKQESYNLGMKMDLELTAGTSGINVDMAINMDMDMAVNLKPEEIVHGKATMNMNLLGQSQKIDMETYSYKEDGKTITLTKSSDSDWEREEMTDSLGDAFNTYGLSGFEDFADSMTLEDKTETIDNMECYVLKGDIKGEAVKGVMDTMMGAMNNKEGLDKVDWEKLEMPIQIYIDKDKKLPVKLKYDVSNFFEGAMGDLMAAGEDSDATIDMKKGDLELTCDSFGEVEVIEIPSDIKQGSKDQTAA